MKKSLWIGGSFLAVVAAQLLCTLLFLFLQADPLVEGMVLAVLLLLSAVPLVLFTPFLKLLKKSGDLDEQTLVLAYTLRGQLSRVMAAAVLNLIVTILTAFQDFSILLPVASAVAFVAACVFSAVQVYRILRPVREDGAGGEAPVTFSEEPWEEA